MAAKKDLSFDFGSDFNPDDMSGWMTGGGIDGSGGLPDWMTSPPDFGNNGAGTNAPGDSAQGGGGIDPGSGSIPFDQAAFTRLLSGLGSGSGSSGLGSALSRIFGGNGSSSALNSLLPLLLPGLASAYSGISTNHAIDQARNDMLTGIGNANSAVQSAYDKSNGLFTPYIQAGQGALQNLQGMQGSNLASQFNPLGSGRSLKSLGGR